MDIDYLLLLQGLRESTNNAFDTFFLYVSKLGVPTIGLILSAALYWSVSKRTGMFMLIGFNIGCLINGLLKISFCAYRPWVRSDAIHPVQDALADSTGYSFPSGHSVNGVTFFGGMGFAQRKRWPALLGCTTALALLIGFSRNYLGVHTPQDVIVGLAVGVLALWVTDRLLRWEQAAPGRDRWVLLGVATFCVGLIAFAQLRAYPLDYDAAGNLLVDPDKMNNDTFATAGAALGFFAGWFWEKRKINFKVNGAIWLRLVRDTIGIAGLLFISKNLTKAMRAVMGVNWGNLVAAFILMFFMAGLYPWLFSKVQSFIVKRKA